MRKLLFVLLVINFAYSQWQTFYEKSDHLETPPYLETIKYTKKMARQSSLANYRSFGTSPQGRDLPLLIVDKDGLTDPVSIREKGRLIVLIEAGIHSGEIEGKDAGFLIFRDLLFFEKNLHWLDRISFLFIPILNVDGHERFSPYGRINQNGPKEMGWRTTAQNLNLNRDFLKADTPEMQAWLKLYQLWLPEFFIDIHTTDGADFQYPITYAVENKGNMAPPVTRWLNESYINQLEEMMKDAGAPTRSYVFFRRKHDVQSGLLSWVATPRFSQGYTALHNRPGLLVETHMLKDYKTRVEATVAILKSTFDLLEKEHLNLIKAIMASEEHVVGDDFQNSPFTLRWMMNGDSVMVDFLGFEYEKKESTLSGGQWYRYSDRTTTMKVPFFNGQKPVVFSKVPQVYIIPPEWQTVINRLQTHGVEMVKLNKDVKLKIQTYRFEDIKFSSSPYEGRFSPRFNMIEITEERLIPAGSMVIPLRQNRAPLIMHALEPEGRDSFLAWGFFNAIFERKEYAESYVMEELAREMLEKDPDLKTRFSKKVKSDSVFAANPREILNWFYRQTPFFDQKLNIYPVARIFSAEDAATLLGQTGNLREEK